MFNGSFPIPFPPPPEPGPVTKIITLPFTSLINNFIFNSNIFIEKGSVICLPEREEENLLDLSNTGKKTPQLPFIDLNLLNFKLTEPPKKNTFIKLINRTNIFSGKTIIKSIDNETPIDFSLIFYYGEFLVVENLPIPHNISLAAGLTFKFKNPPVPPGPVNPEVVNISLDFKNNSYSPDHDFYISKNSKIQTDPNLLSNIIIVKPNTVSTTFNLPIILNLTQASSSDQDEEDPNLFYYHFPQSVKQNLRIIFIQILQYLSYVIYQQQNSRLL